MATLTKVFYPGRRLSYSGARCTVRYIGQVEDTKGEWLGVEWDDDSKGKHDGSHNGVKYFTCEFKQVKSLINMCISVKAN